MRIIVDGNQIGDEAVKILALGVMTELKILDLGRNKFTGDAIRHMRLAKWPKMTTLRLSNFLAYKV